jgi:hypothetical protein
MVHYYDAQGKPTDERVNIRGMTGLKIITREDVDKKIPDVLKAIIEGGITDIPASDGGRWVITKRDKRRAKEWLKEFEASSAPEDQGESWLAKARRGFHETFTSLVEPKDRAPPGTFFLEGGRPVAAVFFSRYGKVSSLEIFGDEDGNPLPPDVAESIMSFRHKTLSDTNVIDISPSA